EDRLCHHFALHYDVKVGYGKGTRKVLETIKEGGDHRQVAATFFPGGSPRNGAAMRVTPVGLFFHDDLEQVSEQARLSALPTHVHPLGVEGAQLLALGVALALRGGPFDRPAFFGELLAHCQAEEFRARLALASRAQSMD